MIPIISYPGPDELEALLQRPSENYTDLFAPVGDILEQVRQKGDEALVSFNRQFDGYNSNDLEVTDEEWQRGADSIPVPLKNAIDHAAVNIETFHRAQREKPQLIAIAEGVQCWRRSVGIGRVGLYVPGGSAPLFSTLLMLAIPARLAGCKEIIACTPPGSNGSIHPAILYAARTCGVTRLFRTGGAQAIAAMAWGTQSVPRVSKIFGPGNRYVTAAKMLVQLQGVAIDIPAGPSELAVLADDTGIPAFVAADLLSQAEHGADSQVLLVSNSETLIGAVNKELAIQLETLPRKEIARLALSNSKTILVGNMDAGIQVINQYAPEHLIIAAEDPEGLAEEVVNAGSVFLGNYSPESAGDYASGTNHTLPTNGHARACGGVSLDSFVRKITYQHLTPAGLEGLADTIEQMAVAEGLHAHAAAVRVRTQKNTEA